MRLRIDLDMTRLAALVLLVFAAAGCGLDRDKAILMAAGSYGDLAVLVPDEAAVPLANRFLTRFNVTHTFVIKEEAEFRPDVFAGEKWELGKGYKNVLLLVDLTDDSKVARAARGIVSGDTWRRLEEAGGGIVRVNDPWSTYQRAVVVAARGRNTLGSVLMRNAEELRDGFVASNRERIQRRHRYDGLADDVMTRLWRQHHIFLEVPAEFRLNQDRPDGYPGVELMRNAPSRGLTLAWHEMEDPAATLADRDALLALRVEMGARMHDEELVPETLVWRDVQLGRNPAVKLEGAWNSNRFAGGGPFWCYFVADPARDRVLCLDLLIFHPGGEKMDDFRRLDAIAHTLATERPQP